MGSLTSVIVIFFMLSITWIGLAETLRLSRDVVASGIAAVLVVLIIVILWDREN